MEDEAIDTEAAQIAAAKKADDLRELQENEDMRAVLATYGGRRFMWKLLGICGLYADPFRGEETHAMARETGKMFVGLRLVENIFTADPNAYTLLRNEAAKRKLEQEAGEK